MVKMMMPHATKETYWIYVHSELHDEVWLYLGLVKKATDFITGDQSVTSRRERAIRVLTSVEVAALTEGASEEHAAVEARQNLQRQTNMEEAKGNQTGKGKGKR
jgi:hypothetical protein